MELSLTGFEPAEIDALFADLTDPENDPDDELPEIETKTVSRRGDLWLLGKRHRLMCDDARQADYSRLMAGGRAAMVFTDPPYNVSIPQVVGRGRIKHRDFANASGEMSPAEFTDFLTKSLNSLREYSQDGALHYVFMDWRHMRELLDAGSRSLRRNEKSHRVDEDECRARLFLSIRARIDICIQIRLGPASEQH